MKQYCITTAMGKRLIGLGMALHPAVKKVLQSGRLVIIAGTTNGYVAEEILRSTHQEEGFSREGFRRGVTIAPGATLKKTEFAGDVMLKDGEWQKGKTIFDVSEEIEEGDLILKGANAFDARGKAAIQIGSPVAGTVTEAIKAHYGRRAQIIIPVGLEKRVLEDCDTLAKLCNAPGAQGPRLLPVPGTIFTELHAIEILSGAKASLIAGGGVYGAEGAYWIGVQGDDNQISPFGEIIKKLQSEPKCEV